MEQFSYKNGFEMKNIYVKASMYMNVKSDIYESFSQKLASLIIDVIYWVVVFNHGVPIASCQKLALAHSSSLLN